jgi:hypothetical protein
MAAVVCRTGTKAQTEFSIEKKKRKKLENAHVWHPPQSSLPHFSDFVLIPTKKKKHYR